VGHETWLSRVGFCPDSHKGDSHSRQQATAWLTTQPTYIHWALLVAAKFPIEKYATCTTWAVVLYQPAATQNGLRCQKGVGVTLYSLVLTGRPSAVAGVRVNEASLDLLQHQTSLSRAVVALHRPTDAD
jgi:hypothetical protein